jgi:selenocysteine-specific elongation factor
MDGSEELEPGGRTLAQVRLEEPLAPRYDDRFIVRSYSPVHTIGGGKVLDASPPRRTQLHEHERALLRMLAACDLSGAAIGLLVSRALPMTSAQVASDLGLPRAGVARDLNTSDLQRLKVGPDTYYVTPEGLDRLLSIAVSRLREYHEEHPLATGITAGALRDRVDRRVTQRVFDAVLAMAAERGLVRITGGEVRHAQAAAGALAEEDAALAAIEPILQEQGLAPGTVAELAGIAGVDAGVARRALTKLVAAGHVVRLGHDLHFAASAVTAARDRIVQHLKGSGTMLAKDARDVLGTSRKYVVPLLEYFDAQGVTKRDGDVRSLRSR